MKRITFTIGQGKDKDGKILGEAFIGLATPHAYKRVAETFGGYTATRAEGGWRHPQTGELIQEPSLVISVLAEDSKVTYVHNTAVFLRDLYHQECVVVTVETLDRVEFV